MRPTYHLVPGRDLGRARRQRRTRRRASRRGLHPLHRRRRGDGRRRRTATTATIPGSFLVLTVDLDATGSPWRFDDQAGLYPHVYGMIAPGGGRSGRSRSRGPPTARSWRSAGDVPAGIAGGDDLRRRGDLRPGRRAAATGGPARAPHPYRRAAPRGPGDRSRRLSRLQQRRCSSSRPAARKRRSTLFRDDVYIRTGVWTTISAKPFGRVVPTSRDGTVGD